MDSETDLTVKKDDEREQTKGQIFIEIPSPDNWQGLVMKDGGITSR